MHIPRPCPATLSRLQPQNDSSFYCQGCQKNVIDCREKSRDEIKAIKEPDFCGIFNEEQLDAPARYTGWNHLLFLALTGLSVLGFSVQPLKAQTQNPVQVDTIQAQPNQKQQVSAVSVNEPFEQKADEKATNSDPAPNRTKRLFRRKRRHFRSMGCPKF